MKHLVLFGYGFGTVFRINTDGSEFTNLYNFTALDPDDDTTNSDGAYPVDGLILSGNTLYGTAEDGGYYGDGTVFALQTDGSGFTTLYSFTAISGSSQTNSDGAYPADGLILSGNTLYGTAQNGGASGKGTVFSFNTGSSGFTKLEFNQQWHRHSEQQLYLFKHGDGRHRVLPSPVAVR